ncbi:Prolipoprotein [Mycoplasma leachii 99/014/6]|nr:Prolipoprotein [Mycoplasma leachii 99/014/6]
MNNMKKLLISFSASILLSGVAATVVSCANTEMSKNKKDKDKDLKSDKNKDQNNKFDKSKNQNSKPNNNDQNSKSNQDKTSPKDNPSTQSESEKQENSKQYDLDKLITNKFISIDGSGTGDGKLAKLPQNSQEYLDLIKKQNPKFKLTLNNVSFNVEENDNSGYKKVSVSTKGNSKNPVIVYFYKDRHDTVYEGEKKEVVKEIGWSKSTYSTDILHFDEQTKEVPENLPPFITSLEGAFRNNAQETIKNLDKWDTSNIEFMNETFYEAKNFNQDISGWKTNNVSNMDSMFYGASSFDRNLSGWNVDKVITYIEFNKDSKISQENKPKFKELKRIHQGQGATKILHDRGFLNKMNL